MSEDKKIETPDTSVKEPKAVSIAGKIVKIGTLPFALGLDVFDLIQAGRKKITDDIADPLISFIKTEEAKQIIELVLKSVAPTETIDLALAGLPELKRFLGIIEEYNFSDSQDADLLKNANRARSMVGGVAPLEATILRILGILEAQATPEEKLKDIETVTGRLFQMVNSSMNSGNSQAEASENSQDGSTRTPEESTETPLNSESGSSEQQKTAEGDQFPVKLG